MGGRDRKREAVSEHNSWIQDVSTDRLKGYERMLASSGADKRIDGSVRHVGFMRDLVQSELKRRNDK